MNRFLQKLVVLVLILHMQPAFISTAKAGVLDWSNVSLTGTFPTFSFVASTLGNVTVAYSSSTEEFGISTVFGGGEDTLLLGATGDESVTISWSNPITSVNLALWDIDYSGAGGVNEAVQISALASISPIFIHATDVWDLFTTTLSADGVTINSQVDPNNFSVLNFSNPSGFLSITLTWDLAGGNGTGSLGIGDLTSVPEPTTLALLTLGLAGLGVTRRGTAGSTMEALSGQQKVFRVLMRAFQRLGSL